MSLELHTALAEFNRVRLSPTFAPELSDENWRFAISQERAMLVREGELVESERRAIRDRAAAAPKDSVAFVRWFERLLEDGPGQGDPLFPWLAEHASYDQLRWFLRQEAAGEAGFDDLVAMTQVKMPTVAKLELARNYWDEMGRGKESGMHGPMLERLCDAFAVAQHPAPIVWESLALGNLMVAFAANRRYAYQSIGALGVIELTAPGRATCVNRAMQRLGLPPSARQYFALHSTLDVRHSAAWNEHVIGPMVAAEPRVATAFAEGALMRLEAGRRCFDRYRAELLSAQPKRQAIP